MVFKKTSIPRSNISRIHSGAMRLFMQQVLFCAACAFSPVAFAVPSFNMVGYTLHENGKLAVSASEKNPQGIVNVSDSFTSGGRTASTSAAGYASFGVLKISASADADLTMQAGVEIGASFFDTIRFSSAGLAGSTGR